MYGIYLEGSSIEVFDTIEEVVDILEKEMCTGCLPVKEGGYLEHDGIDLSKYRKMDIIDKLRELLTKTKCGQYIEYCGEIEELINS